MKKNKELKKIVQRIPYSTISIDHQNIFSIVEKADDFEKVIDKKAKQLENQNINISTCPEYFENMVNKYIAKLIVKLESEHVKNMHVIGYLFRKRASDKAEFQELLNRLDAEIDSTKAEYEVIKNIAKKFNPLKNGKLEEETIHKQKEAELNE